MSGLAAVTTCAYGTVIVGDDAEMTLLRIAAVRMS